MNGAVYDKPNLAQPGRCDSPKHMIHETPGPSRVDPEGSQQPQPKPSSGVALFSAAATTSRRQWGARQGAARETSPPAARSGEGQTRGTRTLRLNSFLAARPLFLLPELWGMEGHEKGKKTKRWRKKRNAAKKRKVEGKRKEEMNTV